jgi:hypothetical protein
MAAYRRRYSGSYNNFGGSRGKTKVTFAWDSLVEIYNLKFHDWNNPDDIKATISFLKTLPYGEARDYDPETKVWGIKESYFQVVKILLENVKNFDCVIIEKPEGAPNGGFLGLDGTPINKYIATFEEITGLKLQEQNGNWLKYDDAKKSYRRTVLKLHPDRNPDNPASAEQMSKLNESWSQLEVRHFKVKEFAQMET